MGFDLLRDFQVALNTLDIEGVDVDGLDRKQIENEVCTPMIKALKGAAGSVYAYPLDWLRAQAQNEVKSSEFCITLDHRVYFSEAAFELDVTRAASDIHRIGSKYLVRRPRKRSDSLPSQFRRLRQVFDASKATRAVLADDGLSTGETLRMVIDLCRTHEIPLRRIIVCCNNTYEHQLELGGLRIASIIKGTLGRPWINERDLYWGLPRSGLSFAPDLSDKQIYGIPFSATRRLVRQRIGVRDDIDDFYSKCLRANQLLWELFESNAGRELFFEDCPPLRFMPDILERRGERVVDLLGRLADGQDELNLEASEAV